MHTHTHTHTQRLQVFYPLDGALYKFKSLSVSLSPKQTHTHTDGCALGLSYLLDVCVEGHRHVQQDLPLLHAPYKVLDAVLQLTGRLVDLLRVTLARLGQLLCCFQQLVSIGVGVLSGGGASLP